MEENSVAGIAGLMRCRTMFTMLDKQQVKRASNRPVLLHLTSAQHAKRRRIIADRYANSNVTRPIPMQGIQDRCNSFLNRCHDSVGGHLDIFVRLVQGLPRA
jgi:hypothetical protein